MEENITEVITNLVFQMAVIIFAVRVFGKLAAKVGIPSVLGELIAGIVIGPFALGGIPFPGFPHGLFGVENSIAGAVSPELYAFGQIASIILLFSSGLETDLSLFLKYSVSGGIIGLGGVVVSFIFGDICALWILPMLGADCSGFMDIKCLFFGIMSTATSVGITARILSDKKKMDSPEGVTILASAVFDDVLGIVLLAIVMGIVAALGTGGTLSGGKIGLIALKAFGVWLVATVVFIAISKKIAKFVRLFGGTYDFSIAALGVAFLLAGFFEKQSIAMIIGAYTTGLALSGTDIAPVIEERIHGLYKFFVPLFFAVTGMSVDVSHLFTRDVLVCGGIYTVVAVVSKLIGCGGPALALGFNIKGGFRIGAGMIPRGEVALIIAGIGLAAKGPDGLPIIGPELFNVVILMTLVTTLIAPPILNISLSIKGRGTKKEVSLSESQQFIWDFKDFEIARLVLDSFIRDLRAESFYVQTMNMDEGLTHARKENISISIQQDGSVLTIEAAQADMGFVKGEIYEVMLRLNKSLATLGSLRNTDKLQYGFASPENRVEKLAYKILDEKCISCNLKGNTKQEIIEELSALLSNSGCVTDGKLLVADMKARDEAMSTGIGKGIAIPHARTDGVSEICVAIGIKKDGIDFGSLDGLPSRIFVMIASPASKSGPQMRVMAALTGALSKDDVRSGILAAETPAQVMEQLKGACR